MLTSTSVSAVQFLLYVHQADPAKNVLPADAAVQLGASPSYLSKIVSLLAKADIVQTFRGAKGGVRLAREPHEITLLDIVEACQGRILGDYCREWDRLEDVCAFHAAMYDLQESIIRSLSRFSLADLAGKLLANPEVQARCRMRCVFPKAALAELLAAHGASLPPGR